MEKLMRILIVGLFICPLFPGLSKAQQVPLSVGFGIQDITPETAVKNWVTGKPYTRVNDPLHTRVLVISDGLTKSAIVSLDLVDAGESATDEIRKAVGKELGIAGNHILVAATHNHSAPWAPAYKPGYRGKENDTWWAVRFTPAQNNHPPFKRWMDKLLKSVVAAAKAANDHLEPATLWIGKADISAFANNRRPVTPQWGVLRDSAPKGYNYKHPAYNPDVITGGSNYGPMDRTMSIVSFRNAGGQNIASMFHMSVHSVSIYPYSEEISADWPAEAIRQIEQQLGGNALFLQGAAGDINPWRRGREAVNEMGLGVAGRAKGAFDLSVQLNTDSVRVKKAAAALPLDKTGKERTGLELVPAEVQVFSIGPLAIVTLPGEPLTDMGVAIRKRSPFPHTLVLGYANGNGVHYVAPPGEKAKGGYEMGPGTVGTDDAGLILIETAVRLLNETVRLPK